MDIKEVEIKMSELVEKAKVHPEKRPIYRLQWKAYRAALDIYHREHPQEQLKIGT